MDRIEKCLFSGEILSGNVKPEHIIQAGLGGRITSQSIMSSRVNELFSKYDQELVRRYYIVMQNLYFLLPSRARPGLMEFDIPGGEGKLVSDRGRLRPKKNITKIRIDERPTSLISDVEKLPIHLRDSVDPNEIVLFSDLKDNNGDCFTFEGLSLSPDIDSAIVKIAVSTTAFIAMNYNISDLQAAVEPLCKLVFASVSDRKVQEEMISNHSFGFQLEPTVHFDKLIDRIWGRKRPFAHYVFCYSNPIRRTVDALVYMFGYEGFGIRIADRFDSSFGFAIENGVFKDQVFDVRKFDPDDNTEIQYSNRKSIDRGPIGNPSAMIDLMNESFESLISESGFYSEAYSIDHFVQSLEIAHDYWLVSRGSTGYDSLGDYLRVHIKKYYEPVLPEFPTEFLADFKKFDSLKFRNTPFEKFELEVPFDTYSFVLTRLSSTYGIPRHVTRRPRPDDLSIREIPGSMFPSTSN